MKDEVKEPRKGIRHKTYPPFLKSPRGSAKHFKHVVKNPIGRPSKEIDWELVYRCSKIHCTAEEIATVLQISHGTLVARPEFTEVYRKGISEGKMSLRRKQFKVALSGEGNVSMLIWLGKNWLGQTDRYYQQVSGPDGGPLQVVAESHREQLRNLNIDELRVLKSLLSKATSPNVIDVAPVQVLTSGKVNGKANGKASNKANGKGSHERE